MAFPTLPMQMYTIGDNNEIFSFPDISTTDCPFDYTYAVEDTSAGAAITFDIINFEFLVFWITDLSLSGGTTTDFIDYTVTITATINDATGVTTDGSFTLQIKNPCVDPTRVSIQEDTATTLPAISYIVTDPEEDYPHGSFSIVTSPNTHMLCEPILLTPDFDGPIN